MENFDFIKGLIGIDILQAEAVAKVAGRVTGAAVTEMMEAGLTESQAIKLMGTMVRTALEAAKTFAKEG